MNHDAEPLRCPLCRSDRWKPFHRDKVRPYLRCLQCELVFVPEPFWIDREAERATYDLHQNDSADPDYCRFLSRLSVPLLQRLAVPSTGLDFGCGPGPALSSLLEAHGHRVDLYDPFYYNDSSVFDNIYDFVCASEVVEHLHHPGDTFPTLFSLLRSGGWLAIMTKLVIDADAFKNWHYIRDPTHICFYSHRTFKYLSRRLDAGLEIVAQDVILLSKS
jgi:hypothetical protein